MNPEIEYYQHIETIERLIPNGAIIGTTNGCFDPVHAGHITLFKKAKQMCDYLVVGINTQGYIKKKKKFNYWTLEQRAEVLRAIKYIDFVYLMDHDSPRRMIMTLEPKYHFLGIEYEKKKIPEKELQKYLDFKIIYVPKKYNISGSLMTKKVKYLVRRKDEN